MDWYLSKIVFQVICGDGKHTPQFDEQYRLINACDFDEALKKSLEAGRLAESTFQNANKQLVCWKFINVSSLQRMDMIDGSEIFSRIVEVPDADAYRKFIHKQADSLTETDLVFQFN